MSRGIAFLFSTVKGTSSDIYEYDINDEPKVTRQKVRIKLSYSGSRPAEHESSPPFHGDQVHGKASAIIDDDGHLRFEWVTGKVKQFSSRKKEKPPAKHFPFGSLEWENDWAYRYWIAKQGDPTVRWAKIEGRSVAVGEDKFTDGFRYGVERVPGTAIKWNTDDLFPTEYDAKRAALTELARILSP